MSDKRATTDAIKLYSTDASSLLVLFFCVCTLLPFPLERPKKDLMRAFGLPPFVQANVLLAADVCCCLLKVSRSNGWVCY